MTSASSIDLMRNFAALIGAVVGGYFGWLTGTVVDDFTAWLNQGRPDHMYVYVFTFGMASVLALSFRSIVGDLTARFAAAESNVEHAAAKIERTQKHSGRTPPAPSPAFQG
jgi:membrane protein YqaA with SNARE-associated domain